MRSEKQKIPIIRSVMELYPLTFTGTLLFSASLFLMGKAFTSRNPYGWVLAAVVIFLLFILAVAGRLQARRAGKCQVEWDSSLPVFSRRSGQHQVLSVEDLRLLPFFRLHFSLRGKMQVGRDSHLYLSQEASSHRLERVVLPLSIPLSGILHGKGTLSIKDFFGLTRSRFGDEMLRRIVVRPGLLPNLAPVPVQALDGLENKSKHKESDVERYFMREYIPGDRYRDINWKASSRFNDLFTRIAPVTQEKTHVLSVVLRPYRKPSRESVQSLAHLNFIKSWLLLFLKSVKQAHSEYQFDVAVGSEKRLLKNQEEIENFSVELSGMFFQSPQPPAQDDPIIAPQGQVFIFTTPFDDTLRRILVPRDDVFIFTSAFPEEKNRLDKEDTAVRLPLVQTDNSLFLPGSWFYHTEHRKPAVFPAGGAGIRVFREPLLVTRIGSSREV